MVHGLHHVHEKNIIHRDLKPSNVFAAHIGDTPLHFKIGDFGLSKLIPSTHMDPFQSTAGRPTQWRRGRLQRQRQLLLLEPAEPHDAFSKSPDDETIQSDVKDSSWYHHHTAGVGTASYAAPEQVVTETYGTAVDIFSLGLILLELACCFSTEHERLQTFHKCRHQRIVPSEIHDKYPMMAETILNCTKPNPKQRPTAAKLKSIDLRQQSHIKDDIHFSNDLDHVLRPTPRVNGSSVEEMRKQLIDKEQQITELKLQLEIYQQELMRKDQMIESLSQSHSTGILDSTTMDKNEK
jgi:serine/threonine protein kinase